MSIYKSYSQEQLDALFSEFLINSWSFSKLSTFSRNEKAFEMTHIYGYSWKQSSTAVSGSAYHKALEYFFLNLKQGLETSLVDAEQVAFQYIEEVKANEWQIQKTTPTVEECKVKALKTVSALLKNFFNEINTYLEDIEDVIAVEEYCNEFLTINGVDIPLPCHGMVDVRIKTKSGKTAIIDHKSKAKFSDDEEIKLTIGRQAITYVNLIESKIGEKVDEVWFIENKYSQNRDNSPQLNCFKITIDDDVKRLYESLLYEPLRRMISAVNDPDYVYMINDQDNFVDKAEIYDFWCKTMIAEIDEFIVDPTKRDLIEKRLKKIRDSSIKTMNPSVIQKFRKEASNFIQYDLSAQNMSQEEKIQHVLRSFGIIVKVAYKFDGYSSNTYLLEVSAGIKITSIQNHKLDIANALDVSTVRISKDLVVYNEKSYLSVEFGKKRDKILYWDDFEAEAYRIPLGKDNFNNTIIWDLENHSTPHVLICGATGSGKSVSIKSTIEYSKLLGIDRSGVDRIIIFDPKYEFISYKSDSKVEVYNEIIEIEEEMAKLVEYMNELVKQGRKERILVVFDEFADAVSASRKGKDLEIWETQEVGYYRQSKEAAMMGLPPQPKTQRVKVGEIKPLEENLRVLLQKGRSSGFRIIAATQRASVKVITGDAKVNFPVQICFRVPKETDSRVVLDEPGAEGLGGMGDGLIKSPEYSEIVRFQAYYKK